LKEIHCERCGNLLFEGWVLRVDVKCPNCGYVNQFAAKCCHDVEEFYPVEDNIDE